MDAFYIYLICSITTLWGFIIFSWWWFKARKATEVYRYITLLLLAEFIEKSALALWRYHKMNGLYYLGEVKLIDAPWWPYITLPTTLAFLAIVSAMTYRIYKSYFAYTRDPELRPVMGKAQRSVLVISLVKDTKSFLRGVFASNDIKYRQAGDFLSGLEMLIAEEDIPVVMVGLSAIVESGLSQSDVVKMIKKERPWCIVVAITRQPNMYELLEVRRSFFDDYLHLPASRIFIVRSFDRWVARINRWRSINGGDRRIKDGSVTNRKNFRMRKPAGEKKQRK